MEKKGTQVMDIVIFGFCLFGILILREYRAEVSATVQWWIPAMPLALVGLFFGFRGANASRINAGKTEK
ncbi:hypothetical protein MMIC_P0172 [Mariprofundus micogutta]|uniref:Uncharacterized protein n=1 Tax=Mariprofundus micogutta TaxID=1921010 RepID=A0A1L8CK09_9PROT|nr:hypothetical protein [Mariprofundus micogutta]GAV19243.1 hypothetical protein MMIC_P0172 [Mariprofundus micogutta]